MIEENSKTPLVIGIVLASLCALACLIGGAFMFLGVRRAAVAPVAVTVTTPVAPQLTVALQPDGGVWVDDQQVLPADLEAHLADRFRATGDAQVVIAADRSLPHQQVIDAVDGVKKAGYTRLAMAVSAEPLDGG